jgi:radical SAM superfamily enzyme YgiQ (UPF0313 family)
LLQEIKLICERSDLIGISLMTNQFVQASMITKFLKEQGVRAPIIWGGIHPTVEPESCLDYADMVCIGEGEDALIELLNCMESGNTYWETRNIWFKRGQAIIRNSLRPLIQNPDTIPFPDYSCRDHYIAQGEHIDELTRDRFVHFKGERFNGDGKAIHYPIMTSRGCPYNCTYCCNDIYHQLYPKQKQLRWRSIENIINELKTIQREVSPISFVYIVDDNFTARSLNDLKEFGRRYRAEIGIPFFCQCSPLTISDDRMEILLEAGCAKITMGVETGSERIAKMYNRERFHNAVPNAIAIIEKYRDRMPNPASYQFIIDNPFETVDETLETLKIAVGLRKPWNSPIYSLMLYPGTTLYKTAMQSGLITDKYSQIYCRDWLDQSKPFFQFWVRLYRANYPSLLLRILLKPWIAKLLTSNAVANIWKTYPFCRLWTRGR